jgi:hypothetical protein
MPLTISYNNTSKTQNKTSFLTSELQKSAIAPLETNNTLERGKAFLELITRISVNNRVIAQSFVNQFELYDYNDYLTSLDGKRRHRYWHSVRYLQETGETWQFIRQDDKNKRGYVYRAPLKIGNRAFLPVIPRDIRRAINKRYGVKVPTGGSFWEWLKDHPEIPIFITEGAGKGLSGLSHGFVTIALYGCSCLGSPDLLPYLKDRHVYIALDSDTKPSAVLAVKKAIVKHHKSLSKKAKSVKVVTWDSQNKGIDDLIANCGAIAFEKAIATAKSADDWLFEQSLNEARQRLKVSDKLTHDIEITHDEFKKLDHDSLMALTKDARDIAINAFTGAGKTELAAKTVAKCLYAIAPFHRRALAQSAAIRLGLTYRTDTTHMGNDLITSDGYVDKLSTCIEALLGLIKAINSLLNKGAISFGDEFDQQLESLALSSTHSKDGRRRLHTDTFWQIFTRAIKTLIASADITDYEINQFHQRTGRKPYVIKVKSVKKDYKAYVYQQFADFWQKFNEARLQGKRILVLCTRKEDAKFLAFAYGAVPVHADNANDYREFLDNGNDWLETEKPILMAVSPVLGTGFSITHDAFDVVFGWFKADNIPAKGLIQFLNRYRLPVDRHIFCDYSSNRFEGLTPNELYQTRLAKARLNPVFEGEASFINPDDPYFHYKAETNWSLAHLRADLFARLERDVETVEYVRSVLDSNELKNITRELSAKLTEYRDTYPIAVFEARNLSMSEYIAMKDRQDLSESDRLAITKFEIADWSGLTPEQLTLDRVKRDRKGKKRKESERLEMQAFPQIAQAIDKNSIEKQSRHGAGLSQQDISHHSLLQKALERFGIDDVLDFALRGETWCNDTPFVIAIAQKWFVNREALAKLGFRISCGKNANACAVFGAILKWFGLKRISEQKRVDGKLVRFYKLCPEDLELTKADLIARLPRNIERFGALSVDPQNSFVERIYGSHTPFVNTKYQEVCDSKKASTETAFDQEKLSRGLMNLIATEQKDIQPPNAPPDPLDDDEFF